MRFVAYHKIAKIEHPLWCFKFFHFCSHFYFEFHYILILVFLQILSSVLCWIFVKFLFFSVLPLLSLFCFFGAVFFVTIWFFYFLEFCVYAITPHWFLFMFLWRTLSIVCIFVFKFLCQIYVLWRPFASMLGFLNLCNCFKFIFWFYIFCLQIEHEHFSTSNGLSFLLTVARL